MIKLKYSIDSISIFPNKFQESITKRIEQLIRSAAYQFLRAAAPRIRIRTGFAHGSLRVLARALNTELPPGTPGTTPRAKEFYYFGGGSKVRKSPTTGTYFSTPLSMIFTKQGNGNVIFTFEIDIAYFRRRDVAEWRAFDAGVKAMENYIARNIEDVIPDLDDYIRVIKGNFRGPANN